ncbi:MAG: hypothetical protein WC378_03975 [Opitutaceae bacterium]
MKPSRRLVKVSPGCYRVYVSASRILRHKLGAKAPDADDLIRLELSNRDPQMIAADYLETRVRRSRAQSSGRRARTHTRATLLSPPIKVTIPRPIKVLDPALN